MTLSTDADYIDYLYTCNRCRCCTTDNTDEMRPVCPAYSCYGFFAFSGGGKGYVSQGILEGKVRPSTEAIDVAMKCLLCGACASMCPPGFDTISFIRDLRSYLVNKGFYINDAHRSVLERARRGEPWGKAKMSGLPVFTGSENILVFAGQRERAKCEIMDSLEKIFKKAGISWGVLENEPDSGAVLADLGDMDGFEKQALKAIDALNSSGAEHVLIIDPHDAAAVMHDYFNVGDVEAEGITLPAFLAGLAADGLISFSGGEPVKVTYHDPCKLARWLEEFDAPRELLSAMDGVELVEMPRRGISTYCSGEGLFADAIIPGLARFAAKERKEEAKATGTDIIVTASSYAVDSLNRISKGKPAAVHIADFTAQRMK